MSDKIDVHLVEKHLDVANASAFGDAERFSDEELQSMELNHGLVSGALGAVAGVFTFLKVGIMRMLGYTPASKASIGALFSAALSIAMELYKRSGMVGKTVAVGAAVVSARKAYGYLQMRRYRKALEGRDFWARPEVRGAREFVCTVVNYARFKDRAGDPVIDVLNHRNGEIESWSLEEIRLRHSDADSFDAAIPLGDEWIKEAAADELDDPVQAELRRLRDKVEKSASVRSRFDLGLKPEEAEEEGKVDYRDRNPMQSLAV